MRNAFLLLILSTGTILSAQQHSAPTVYNLPLASSDCPVNFGAELNSRLIARTVEDAQKHGDSPRLKLTFGHKDAPKILGATVTIHGLSSSRRYLPVSERSAANRTQTFKLDQAAGSPGLAHTEVWVTQMALVRWAEVTELNYADGTTWHPSRFTQCRAVPSLFHPVNLTAQ
jgi:hypothetical protein